MSFDPDQLAALAAVVGGGTFDAAARELHLTPSAVSQRVRALELAAGQVLVLRSRPCRATPAGDVLVRLAAQVALLDDDARAALGAAGTGTEGGGAGRARTRLPVAVNADSLATWFAPVLAASADAPWVLELHLADQDTTAELLRSGAVMAAVTADASPVQGCRSTPLGSLRYRAMASRSVARQWFGEGATQAAWRRAPVVVFTADDRLQHRFVAEMLGSSCDLGPAHLVPAHPAYGRAIASGLGWGMVSVTGDEVDPGSDLVDLAPGRMLEVPLHWQRWSVRAAALDALTDLVRDAAHAL